MKELIAKEFLFGFIALLIAVPAGILFLYMVQFNPSSEGNMTTDEQVWEMDLLLIGCIIGFIGVYIARLAAWAVKAVLVYK